jgi:RNA ligase (TIGR02306 family)
MNNLASIEQITRVYPHSNADALELLEVRNCQVIVPKDKYKEGQKIVFIWPDSILPDKPWAEFYKAKSSRVRAIRLRNEWSMGIVEEIENIIRSEDTYTGYSDARALHDLPIGTEISEMIGVKKYEAPPPKDLQAKGGLPFGIPKTDEENHYKFDTLPYGELCTVTRKRDGSSGSFYYHLESDTFGVMSRSLELKPECPNVWTVHIPQYDIENKLKDYCIQNQISLCVRGESFGNGRNGHKANVDAKEQTSWEMFSVWDIEKRRYIPLEEEHNFITVANACGFEHVPVLEQNVVLTPELIKNYADDDIGFEGVVIHCKGNTFKVISKPYDSRK